MVWAQRQQTGTRSRRDSPKHRLIAPDVRGHGRSDKPPGAYSVPLFAADLAAFCDRRGLSGVHVAGISMGGMLAFELAVRRPDLVRSLVIVNSGPDMVPRSLRFPHADGDAAPRLRVLGPAGLARILAGKLFLAGTSRAASPHRRAPEARTIATPTYAPPAA